MKQGFLEIDDLVLEEEGTVLDRFHLRMFRGDFVELLGTAGSGKADLAAFFAGRMHIKEGSVMIGSGRYRKGETLHDAQIQCLGETPSLAPSLSVAENIMLLSGKRIVRGVIRHRDLETRVNFLLSEFGLGFRADSRVSHLTEGEKRAAELLRAAESGIQFIVIDNIFNSLGQEDVQLIESILGELKKRGVTILVLGGRFPIFRNLSDRVAVLRAGKNVRTFFRENFDREEYVRWAFGASRPNEVREYATGELVRRSGTGEERNPVLEIRKLDGEYLRSFSCSVRAGEIVGLYDMNNRQNRELIRFLAGDVQLPKNTAYLRGKPYLPGSVWAAARLGTAYIPARCLQSAVVGKMSYGENLTLSVMRKNSIMGTFVNRRIEKYLAREFGSELGADHPESMTGAEFDAADKMRIILQRILLQRPAVLLMEDVLSDMNIRMLKIQTDYLARITDTGCAALISSQNLMALRQVCDRIIVMSEPGAGGGHFHEMITERS